MLEQINTSLSNLVTKLEGWLNNVIVLLPNLILAALVMGVGILLTRLVRRWVEKGISRLSRHQAVNKLAVNIITAGFVLLVLLVVLSILNLDTALQSLLAAGGVAGLAVGLALQDPIMNLFSGVMLSTRSTFEIGDWIETNGFIGRIDKITLRSTIIITPQGEQVMIPNKEIYHQPLKNFSSSRERRVDLACGVSYGDDLQQVREVAIRAIKEQVDHNADRPVELFFTEFGDSSINFQLRFWLRNPDWKGHVAARSAAIMALKRAFDEKDIMIPFPIRTLDFGIRGGEPLDHMLKSELDKINGGQ